MTTEHEPSPRGYPWWQWILAVPTILPLAPMLVGTIWTKTRPTLTPKVIWIGYLGVLAAMIVCSVITAPDDSSQVDSTQASAPAQPGQTAPTERRTATTPVPLYTAQQLYDAREANATRFDYELKDKVIGVRGQVVKIDGGNVTLGVDATGFGMDTSGLFGVVLKDLSREEQIALNRGDRVMADCKVGDYIIGSIYMEDCILR